MTEPTRFTAEDYESFAESAHSNVLSAALRQAAETERERETWLFSPSKQTAEQLAQMTRRIAELEQVNCAKLDATEQQRDTLQAEVDRLTQERDEFMVMWERALEQKPGPNGWEHLPICNTHHPVVQPGTRGMTCNCLPDYQKAQYDRDQAQEIARRWHDTVRDIDGEFLSLKSPVLDELLHDAAIIASWNTPKEDTTEEE